MFEALFHRAEVKVENAVNQVVGQAVNRVIVALLGVVCAGFLVSAGYDELLLRFDPITVKLAFAGGFAVVCLLAAAILLRRSPVVATTDASNSQKAFETESQPQPEASAGFVDNEMLSSAMQVAGPLVLPLLLRQLTRNLPLILVLLSAFYVASRPDHTAHGGVDAASAPPM